MNRASDSGSEGRGFESLLGHIRIAPQVRFCEPRRMRIFAAISEDGVSLLFLRSTIGEMAEWSNVAVSKSVVPQGTGGSNPSLSAKRLQSDCKMVVTEAFIIRGNRCRTWSYNDFSLYAVYRPDGLPLGSNSHQSVKFCYRNCYTKLDVAISVAVTAK